MNDLDHYLRILLETDRFTLIDSALNGLQVDRADREIRKMAFAVDASLESFRRAAEYEADLLFVHHGLFWGKPAPLRGTLYSRIRHLLEHDLALYAVHLPLDAHPELGNNAGIAKCLQLEKVEAFGEYKGVKIGYQGTLPGPLGLEEIGERICGKRDTYLGILPYGPEQIRKIGIVSGGAPETVHQAIEEGLDLFITGDASHAIYHDCLEAGINVLFAGHYSTEIWGVRQLAERVRADNRLETCLLDIPTGF